LWRHSSGQITDWLGTASGGFVNNHGAAAASVPGDWNVAGTGDFNGDGRDDILWRHDSGQITAWLGTATGGFVNNHANSSATNSLNWTIAGTGDFNGDGRDDILWRNSTGAVTNWLGTASGGFVSNDSNALAQMASSWAIVGTGDYNGDGRDDILWRNANGALTDWLGKANGGFAVNDVAASATVPLDWQVQSPDAFWI